MEQPTQLWIATQDTTLVYANGWNNLRIPVPKGTLLEGKEGWLYTYKHRIRKLDIYAPKEFASQHLGVGFTHFPEGLELLG
jgi:hypothetical protein